LHLPSTPDTENWLDAEALAKCRDGVRVLNVARGPLVVEGDLQAALDSGKVAGAALDVFRSEPVIEHPLFSYPNVTLTPHLGGSPSGTPGCWPSRSCSVCSAVTPKRRSTRSTRRRWPSSGESSWPRPSARPPATTPTWSG